MRTVSLTWAVCRGGSRGERTDDKDLAGAPPTLDVLEREQRTSRTGNRVEGRSSSWLLPNEARQAGVACGRGADSDATTVPTGFRTRNGCVQLRQDACAMGLAAPRLFRCTGVVGTCGSAFHHDMVDERARLIASATRDSRRHVARNSDDILGRLEPDASDGRCHCESHSVSTAACGFGCPRDARAARHPTLDADQRGQLGLAANWRYQ